MASAHPRYFEDFEAGERFTTKERKVERKDVLAFAELTWDHNSLHTDDSFAKSQGFQGGAIAHGLLTLSMALGLWDSLGMTGNTIVAFAGINKVSFRAPVFPGDVLHLESEVASTRGLKSRPDAGLVTLEMKMAKSGGEVVLEAEAVLILRKRVA